MTLLVLHPWVLTVEGTMASHTVQGQDMSTSQLYEMGAVSTQLKRRSF